MKPSLHQTRRNVFDLADLLVLTGMFIVFVSALAYGYQYGNTLLAAIGGALILGLGLGVAALSRGSLGSRLLLPVLGMAMVALTIRVAHGRIEAHFGVFAFLSLLLVYRDWRAIVAGAGAIAVHHLSFDALQSAGWGTICFSEPGFGRVIEHALFVVAQSACLCWLAIRSEHEARAGAEASRLVEGFVDANGRIDLSVARGGVQTVVGRQFAQALDRLRESLAVVHDAAGSVASAAQEISQGNGDLARRTEQQALQLQQAVGRVAELNGTIRENAQAGTQADTLAGELSQRARRAGSLVGNVVDTMRTIEAGSRRIADIIGVIDGIAFQTNILALNAAVEAARAGDQGRGFAVVAAEVRTLAQRSAQAAREIKDLIESSVRSVADGSRLVDDSGTAMREVVEGVQGVADLIARISRATGEQSTGMADVDQAVSEIDRMTTQNAALVEQAAASAQSLSLQSERMLEAVSSFTRQRA
jgi:methyl-accepting chemotaxis protein